MPPEIPHAEELFIGGRWTEPASDATHAVINPADESVVATMPMASPADVDAAVSEAREAFDHGPWPNMDPADRATYLESLAASVRKRGTEIAELTTAEMGGLSRSTSWVVEMTAEAYEYFAQLCREVPFEYERRRFDRGLSTIRREPVGVVGGIMPWNGPPLAAAKKIGAAIAAGCTVVLKPPPECSTSMYPLGEAIQEAGIPEGVVSILAGGREVGDHLVRHPDVDMVTFTGSLAAGKQVGAACGEGLKRVTLELGGKSAGIVLDDMELDDVVPRLAGLCTMNTGQACLLLSRILVSRSRCDELAERLGTAFASVVVGDPTSPDTQMGPLATRAQLERVLGYIEIAKAEGARLVQGGGRPAGLDKGFYVEPTLFADVTPEMRIAQEEVFGPVICVLPYDTLDEAIEIANGTPFGLSSTVFTHDRELGTKVAARLRSGTVNVDTFAFDIAVPFGGMKQSGVGREGGPEGFEAYLELKTVSYPA